ncbi:MAG: diguanylate cyclase [Deltaproteobacteria bacterium]|nr:diguanylate cyclase [Deltaproteobacteria bacterium]
MKVLVAEDDLTTRSILKAVLMKWGYDVEAVRDGNEALAALLREDAPKLVVLDWMMPGLNGVEICATLRAAENPLPPYIILLTARGKKEDIVQGLQSGANDYILKPFNNEELRARLRVGERMIDLQHQLFQAIEQQKKLAYTDPLTGIANRRAILDRLESEMARARRDQVSLWIAILDIDHFKRINDNFGHLAGDRVLQECVERISRSIRKYDCFGRYGGEEFLLIFPAVESGAEMQTLERIRKTMADREMNVEDNSIHITVSLGAVKWNGSDTMDEMILKADDALYRAKQNGRNRVEYDRQSPAAKNPPVQVPGTER